MPCRKMIFMKILRAFEAPVAKTSSVAKYLVRFVSTGPTTEPQGAKDERASGGKAKERLLPQLIAKIRMTGPMTIGDYMKEALTHPKHGYYMKGDVFGARGDFITSPEISPMFGEMLGVWFLNEWMKLGQPSPVNFVELGPGRGTLISDILRVMSKYESFHKSACVHLVEISPGLTALQRDVLGCNGPCPPYHPQRVPSKFIEHSGAEKEYPTKFGVPVRWHTSYKSVPRSRFTLWLAHEFFDALPVHILRKVDGQWKEVLVAEDNESKEPKLRYVLSRHPTPIARRFVKGYEARSYAEVSPVAAVTMQNLGNRIHEDGGVFLAVDYGHDGEEKDSFRAYKKHEQVDPLESPGEADLTADVDFQALRYWAAEEGNQVLCYGPTSQGEFLQNLGIKIRLEMLLRNVKDEEKRRALVSGFEMITSPGQMGERFKFFAVFPKTVQEIHKNFPPAGFYPLPPV